MWVFLIFLFLCILSLYNFSVYVFQFQLIFYLRTFSYEKLIRSCAYPKEIQCYQVLNSVAIGFLYEKDLLKTSNNIKNTAIHTLGIINYYLWLALNVSE